MIKFDFSGDKPDGYYVKVPDIKAIKEYPKYAATKFGDIIRLKDLHVVKQLDNGNGYKRCYISHVQDKRYVHRMVATAYFGEAPGKEVNHKNGDKSDNSIQNLEWVTHERNMKHAYETGIFSDEVKLRRSFSQRKNPYKDLPMRPYRWNRSYEVAKYICEQGTSRSFLDIGKELGMHRTQVAKYFFQERYRYYPEHKEKS